MFDCYGARDAGGRDLDADSDEGIGAAWILSSLVSV